MAVPSRVVLFSFAHPDDESYLAAGTIARTVTEGEARVILVTATRGEAATLGPDSFVTPSELAEVRAAELRRASALLGVDRVIQLDHPDGRLGAADPVRIRLQLTAVIRRHRPNVVVSFDPNGENLHPDHIAISRFTSDAIAVAADPRWLAELGEPHRIERLLWTPPTPVWTMLRSGRALPDWPGADLVIDTRRFVDLKRQALAAHKSQRAGIDRLLLGQGDVERVLAAEAFRQAWGPDLPERPSGSLFAGLEGQSTGALATS